MPEPRKHNRLRLDADVSWHIADQKASGLGRIVDVSLYGLSFKTEDPFTPAAGIVFSLEVPAVPAFPRLATLRWFRRLRGTVPGLLCGAIFVKEGLDPSGSWTQWITEEAARVSPRAGR